MNKTYPWKDPIKKLIITAAEIANDAIDRYEPKKKKRKKEVKVETII